MARTESEIDSGPKFSLYIDLPSPQVTFTFSPLARHVRSRMLLATEQVCDIWETATSAAINSRAILSD